MKPSSLAVPAAPAWTLRDSVGSIIRRRHIFPASPSSEAAYTKTFFNDFNAASCLEQVAKHKSDLVHYALVAAATAVIDAARKEHGGDDGGGETVAEEDLPAFVKHSEFINCLRTDGFTVACGGKDPTKRKSAKILHAEVASTTSLAGGSSLSVSRGKNSPAAVVSGSASDLSSGNRSSSKDAPKFTRNTPASSAAALDSRLTSSRAILCAAANVAFGNLTPAFPDNESKEIDIADVPQNPNQKADSPNSSPPSSAFVSNMGTIVVEAQTLGQRIVTAANNAARRSDRRYQFRMDSLKFEKYTQSDQRKRNPFAWNLDDPSSDLSRQMHTSVVGLDEGEVIRGSITDTWLDKCLPRILSVLRTGSRNVVYHDVQWSSRHGRIAHLFSELGTCSNAFGPHLIVATKPDVDRFLTEISALRSSYCYSSSPLKQSVRAVGYASDTKSRSKLRKLISGNVKLHEASFNVIVVSYADFLKDYIYFCQVPFDTVLIDDGMSMMALAQGDLNSNIANFWDAIWSKNDHQTGLAGSLSSDWKSALNLDNADHIRDALIGLTTRHRIVTSSTSKVRHRNNTETIPVSGIINIVAPHYAEMVREEWDRSRIASDSASMEHFYKLLARALVVHDSSSDEHNLYELAISALKGHLYTTVRPEDPPPPRLISDEAFVSEGKVASSRKSILVWLGPPETSWLRYELGVADLSPILNAMKNSNTYGNLCEEILPASNTTPSGGATGQLVGSLAFRFAVRCSRHFSSEQGLRQHLSASHAPPGTWLCRTCGGDCTTSQARTHHERSCGQPISGVNGNAAHALGGSTNGGQPVGKGGRQQHGPAGVVGKKKGQRGSSAPTGSPNAETNDPDGSMLVPGYRGVWVNQAGKHFVKVEGKRYIQNGDSEVTLFESADDAAKKYDSLMKSSGLKTPVELNFKEDGKRIVYENMTALSASGLGGSASSVVPALSVINIKDLPPHVKPLLRDPRQTSRTGGNSKRHVYAYRGVCRQARKGHDRWQSQISFMGVNHYLGTYDSEWDSAAIYAWAHLILYGEEATRQAQKEGEEAAAAYEKEKRDIAAGIVPSTPEKKKKSNKKNDQKDKPSAKQQVKGIQDKKRPAKEAPALSAPKKPKMVLPKADNESSVAPILSKSAGAAPLLAPKPSLADLSDIELSKKASLRITAFQKESRRLVRSPIFPPFGNNVTPSFSIGGLSSSSGQVLKSKVPGKAMLFGLSPKMFGWAVPQFQMPIDNGDKINSRLMQEYGTDGINEKFCCILQGTFCVIGNAGQRTRRMLAALGFGEPDLGGGVGPIDCHIGGTVGSCSEIAACIRYSPASSGIFLFSALSDQDIITWNGRRITPSMGSFPLSNNDICSVGARVFVFLVPTK